MEFKHVRLIIGLVSAALLSLIAVQVFWAFSSYKMSEKSIASRSMDAMKKTVETANENIMCFELFSKVPINPHEGIYMVRQKWKDDKFVTHDTSALDTIPMYFANAQGDFPFRWGNIMFQYPIDMEMVLKFRYLLDDTMVAKTHRSIPEGVNLNNYRDKLSDNTPIAERYDTLFLDSVLRTQLNNHSLLEKFHFGFVRNASNTLAYHSAGSNEKKLMASSFRVLLTNDKYFSQPYDLVIYFENYSSMLLAGIRNVLMVSFIVTAILLISFYLFIRIIYRQRKLSELKNDFINNMTHEFKTPLANISVALETLAEKHLTEKEPLAKVYRILGQESERLRENIEKILQVARFEKEKINFSFEKLDIHNVIQKAASSFEPVLEGRKAEVQFSFNASEPVVEADETHLINTICNLIDNSIKYSTNGLHLHIRTENFKEGVMFSVRDNGEGIPKEAQKKIFEKFYRVSNTDIHTVKGFGLGLAYVKTIIDSHKGKIIVRSQLNAGSEFQVYLPFKQQ
jgi:two-component system, OmpR family, phosphate regulon sensor histidine kinase PhoR